MREEFKGSTGHSEFYMLIDSATGLGKTGLIHTDMVGSYTRTRSARVAVTMVTQTVAGAYSSGGFVEIDATNQPGLYRWDHPNAGYVTAADSVVFTLKSPLARTENKEFRLVNINNQIAYAPNAEADAAGGLPISVAGALDLDAILADTDELQTNQGDWLTATGFSTHSAADVYTAFGDGSNLTTLTTATGFSTINPDNTGIAAIKTKTDQLVFTVANQVDSNALTGGGSGATASEVRIEMDANSTKLTAIVADTDELQINQGNWLTATGFSTHSAADVYTAFGDGSNLTALTTATGFATVNPDNSGITAIKTKTDQLVFTVANQVDSNALSGGGTGATASEVRIEMDANSTKLASIVADTNELQTDWADGGRLDLLLDAIPTTPMRGTDSAALAATALSTAVWTGVPTGFLAATFPTTLASTTNITGGTLTTVGTCTTNSDMRGTDGANTVVPDAAGTIPSGMALETTSQTILADTNELQLNQGNWITATGFSTHTAADVWTVGARTVTGGTITTLSGHTPQTGDSFARIGATGSGLTSLATQTSVNTTNDRLGFTLAALAGNCADPQTAAETYSIILGVDTYTIDHTGLDATGTRTTATLTKS